VNWSQDPYHSRPWTQTLHQWTWMGPLLAASAGRRGNQAATALARARNLALDWIARNPPSTWSNKVAADRAGYLAYLIRAAGCRRLLNDGQARRLLQAAQTHAQYLANPANRGKGNHALYVDAGLYLVTMYLPDLPGSPGWRSLAIRRFREGLGTQLEPTEAVNLEHSPGYHFKVYGLVGRFVALPGVTDPAIRAMAAKMRRSAVWFVAPDGSVPRLGDTGRAGAPQWARLQAGRLRGLAPTLRSGFGIVRVPGSYLSVTNALWNFGHSQSDQLTFELWDRGRRIVADTGRFSGPRNSKAEGFTKSAHAHSVLVVDDQDFRDVRTKAAEDDEDGDRPRNQGKFLGSGLTGQGQGAGWYAIEGRNRLLEPLGVQHNRLFLYRPGQALVVLDRVRSRAQHSYTRLFQFDPALRTRGTGRALPLRAGGRTVWLYDAPASGEQGRLVVRGRRAPMLGWINPEDKFERLLPRTAVAYRSRGASVTHVAALGLDGIARASVVSDTGPVTRIRVTLAGRAPTTLTVTRNGNRLAIG
jgi:Heparinase II/III-like protein/Heparinase II/III N-terminus